MTKVVYVRNSLILKIQYRIKDKENDRLIYCTQQDKILRSLSSLSSFVENCKCKDDELFSLSLLWKVTDNSQCRKTKNLLFNLTNKAYHYFFYYFFQEENILSKYQELGSSKLTAMPLIFFLFHEKSLQKVGEILVHFYSQLQQVSSIVTTPDNHETLSLKDVFIA